MASKAKLHQITIRPAEGGVHVETEHMSNRGGQGGGPSVEFHPQGSVHTTRESLHAHLDKHLAHVFPKGQDEKEQEDSAEEYPE